LLEYLFREVGILIQSLQKSYKQYGKLVTPNWLKTLWEKSDMLNIMMEFNNITFEPSMSDVK